MPSASGDAVVAVDAEVARAFVRRLDGWADLLPGYQCHRECSPRVSRWTVRGDLGMFSRVVEAEVEIVEETPIVRVLVRGISERFTGEGTFAVAPIESGRARLDLALDLRAGGPMAPMIDALLKTRMPAMLQVFASALARRIGQHATAPR